MWLISTWGLFCKAFTMLSSWLGDAMRSAMNSSTAVFAVSISTWRRFFSRGPPEADRWTGSYSAGSEERSRQCQKQNPSARTGTTLNRPYLRSASTFSDFSSVVARCLRKAPEIRLAKLCSPFAQASSDATWNCSPWTLRTKVPISTSCKVPLSSFDDDEPRPVNCQARTAPILT